MPDVVVDAAVHPIVDADEEQAKMQTMDDDELARADEVGVQADADEADGHHTADVQANAMRVDGVQADKGQAAPATRITDDDGVGRVRKQAEAGDADAQYELDMLYEQGRDGLVQSDVPTADEEGDAVAKRRCPDEHHGRAAKRARAGATAVGGPHDDVSDSAYRAAVSAVRTPGARTVPNDDASTSAERAARTATLHNSSWEAMTMDVPAACYFVWARSRHETPELAKRLKRIGDVIKVNIRVPLPLVELVHTSTVRDGKNMMIPEELHEDVLEAVRMHLCYHHSDDVIDLQIVKFVEAYAVELQTATAFDCMMLLACQQNSKLVVRLLRLVSPHLTQHVAARVKRTCNERDPDPVAHPPLPEPDDLSGYPSVDTDDGEAREKVDALINSLSDDEVEEGAIDTIAKYRKAIKAVLNDSSIRDLPTFARKMSEITVAAECAVPPEVRKLWRSGNGAGLARYRAVRDVCEALGLDDPWNTRRVDFDRELAGRLARVLGLEKAPARPSTACKHLNAVFRGYGGTFQSGSTRPGAKSGGRRSSNRYYIQLSRTTLST